MADGDDMSLALLKQKVDGHGDILERMSNTMSKLSESVHEISLVLQSTTATKETINRIYEDQKEMKREHDDFSRDVWNEINGETGLKAKINDIKTTLAPMKYVQWVMISILIGVLSMTIADHFDGVKSDSVSKIEIRK